MEPMVNMMEKWGGGIPMDLDERSVKPVAKTEIM